MSASCQFHFRAGIGQLLYCWGLRMGCLVKENKTGLTQIDLWFFPKCTLLKITISFSNPFPFTLFCPLYSPVTITGVCREPRVPSSSSSKSSCRATELSPWTKFCPTAPSQAGWLHTHCAFACSELLSAPPCPMPSWPYCLLNVTLPLVPETLSLTPLTHCVLTTAVTILPLTMWHCVPLFQVAAALRSYWYIL